MLILPALLLLTSCKQGTEVNFLMQSDNDWCVYASNSVVAKLPPVKGACPLTRSISAIKSTGGELKHQRRYCLISRII